MNIQENINLINYTTFKIGGVAKYFVEVSSDDDLRDVFTWVQEKKEKIIILAGGSNILLNDEVIDGVVVKINNNELIVRGDRLECGAGVSLSRIVTMSVGESFVGLEWAIGIPGSIGGAVRGNAGAFGGQIEDLVEIVEVYNLEKNKMEILSNKDCKFSYRESVFKEYNSKYVIWKVFLKLKKGDSVLIRENIEKYINNRTKSQPKLPSAGSIFKNLSAEMIKESNSDLYNMAQEHNIIRNNKIAAGWVIDLLDLRGKKIGGAKISLEHANFIVNSGGATAKDVIILISYIKQQVRDKLKVQLQEEIQYLGF